jgi:DNA transposition AAA+ family ATPase
MRMKTAKEIHEALDELKEAIEPGQIVMKMIDEDVGSGFAAIGALLAGMETVEMIQARTLALILEKLEQGDE